MFVPYPLCFAYCTVTVLFPYLYHIMLRYIGAERWGKMIRIAICDDEERAVASTEKIVKTCLQAQGIGCEITTYTQSRNFSGSIKIVQSKDAMQT